jgi:hypothetical protein
MSALCRAAGVDLSHVGGLIRSLPNPWVVAHHSFASK